MKVEFDFPRKDAAELGLIFLPGAGDAAAEFRHQGFIDELRRRGIDADVALADARAERYLARDIVAGLHQSAVTPLVARGVRRLWLAGVSLGGLGAMLYGWKGAASIEGLLLLAPYLTARGTVARILAAGGLPAWAPGAGDDPEEAGLLRWLARGDVGRASLPVMFLGCGLSDRFAPTSRLLAAQLPLRHVVTADGAHDWPTWRTLWDALLDREPFSTPLRTPTRAVHG